MSLTLVPLPWVLTRPTKGWGEKDKVWRGSFLSVCTTPQLAASNQVQGPGSASVSLCSESGPANERIRLLTHNRLGADGLASTLAWMGVRAAGPAAAKPIRRPITTDDAEVVSLLTN